MHETCAFIYLPQFLVSITLKRQRDRMPASALTSQQEGPTKAKDGNVSVNGCLSLYGWMD